MIVISIVVAAIVVSYILLIGMAFYGWEQSTILDCNTKSKQNRIAKLPKISVIIAARNEQDNIGNLLEHLIVQNYPENRYEIIVVNDFSIDQTVKIIETYTSVYQNIQLVDLVKKEHCGGKKCALQQGIAQATGDLIITTDADCFMSPDWLFCIAQRYVQTRVQMIIAPVLFSDTCKPANWFIKIQALEFISLTGITAGYAALQRPVMCNGANFAYSRRIYQKFNDPFHARYPSGDDVLFMLRYKYYQKNEIKKQTDIAYIKSTDAVVYTLPQLTLTGFIQQRIRWTSKSRAYNDPDTIMVAIVVFAIHLTILLLLVASCINQSLFIHFVLLFATKLIVDFLFLLRITAFFGKTRLLWWFLPAQIFNFIYICTIAILGQFVSYSWKKRNYKSLRNAQKKIRNKAK